MDDEYSVQNLSIYQSLKEEAILKGETILAEYYEKICEIIEQNNKAEEEVFIMK